MELSGEDRTHLEQLWTSPSKLAKEESSPKDKVPQADDGYLVEIQVRRAKSFLRLLPEAHTSFVLWWLTPPAGAGLGCAMHPTHHKTGGARTRWGRRARRQPPPRHRGRAGRACPCTIWLGWKMMLQGGPSPTTLCANGPRHGSKHLVTAELGSWGHLEPCDQPPRKPRPVGCTVPGRVPWTRAQALTPRGSHLCPTSPSSEEPVSPSAAVLFNQPPVPPQRRAQPMGQPMSMLRPAGTPPDPELHTAFPKRSPRARVLSPLQANICTRSSLEWSFPPAATSGRAHLGPPQGHLCRGFMGKARLGVGMLGAPCPHGHAQQMSYRHCRALIFLAFPPSAMWLDNPHLHHVTWSPGR